MVAVSKLTNYRLSPMFGWIGLVLMTVGHIVEWPELPNAARSKKQALELADALDQTTQDMNQLLPSELRLVLEGISGTRDTERVSVFRYFKDKDSNTGFSLVGRYSSNPEFCKEGRGKYVLGKDTISIAWKNHESMETLPDTDRHWDRYVIALAKQGIDEGTARSLTMMSRRLYARAIGDNTGTKQRTAVVVFESTRPQYKDFFDLCRKALSLQEENRLCDLLRCTRQSEDQSGAMALRRGF